MRSLRFWDWQSVRAMVEKIYKELGEEVPRNIPARDWNIVGLAMKYEHERMQFTCVSCEKPIPYGKEIRCLDCKSVLCESCASRHFWPPDGRRPDR